MGLVLLYVVKEIAAAYDSLEISGAEVVVGFIIGALQEHGASGRNPVSDGIFIDHLSAVYV